LGGRVLIFDFKWFYLFSFDGGLDFHKIMDSKIIFFEGMIEFQKSKHFIPFQCFFVTTQVGASG